MMCLWESYKKKKMKKIFFCTLKINEERNQIRIHSSEVRIRTKMSRIPNTDYDCTVHNTPSYCCLPWGRWAGHLAARDSSLSSSPNRQPVPAHSPRCSLTEEKTHYAPTVSPMSTRCPKREKNINTVQVPGTWYLSNTGALPIIGTYLPALK
jgi:hypothetical protein